MSTSIMVGLGLASGCGSTTLGSSKTGQHAVRPVGRPLVGRQISTVHHWTDKRIISDAPSLLRLSNGSMLCTCELWARKERVVDSQYGKDRCLVFRSDDAGESWRQVARLPFASGKLLSHDGAVYFIGSDHHWSGLWITRSADAGHTWTRPVQLRTGRTYAASTGWVIDEDRLYWAGDTFRPSNLTREVFAFAANLRSDLMDPASWRFSQGVRHPGVPQVFGRDKHDRGKWMEPNVIRSGGKLKLVVRIRVSQPGHSAIVPGVAGICDLEDNNDQLDLSFSHYYPVPGAQNQFHIVYDPVSRLHWMTSNMVTGIAEDLYLGWGKERRLLMLHYSADGLNWFTAGAAAVAEHPRQAYNYCSLLIEGDDLLFVSRTALNAANQHDNDRITFHHVPAFRQLALDLHTSRPREQS